MDRDRLGQDAIEAAMRDLDEIFDGYDASPVFRSIMLLAWAKGAHWGLIHGVHEGRLTAEAVIREMKRRTDKE